MTEQDINRDRFQLCKGLYTRHLKTLVAGLVLVTLVTLLLYGAPVSVVGPGPAPTTLYFSPPHSLSGGDMSEVLEAGGERASCTPATHLFFIKTHKCASTTVQNIFLRFGYKRNLTFALPDSGNYLGNPGYFKVKMIPWSLLPPGGRVDIFAVHTRLNPPEHTKVLHQDAPWLTIVREPAALYESLFNYYHMHSTYGLDLHDYKNKPMEELMALPRYGGKFGKNQMLFDLGYSDDLSVSELRAALDDLDTRLHLVMIAELMDESLILLRHLLCWTLEDVVVFTKNARRDEVKPAFDPATLKTLRELNSADVLLYDHFLARHRQAVHKFGAQRMADEVASLRGLRDEFHEDCGLREVKGRDDSLKFKEYSGLVSAYVTANTTDPNCLLLTLPELALVELVRQNQREVLSHTNTPANRTRRRYT